MYIESVSEFAFDDITPDDPDFASIQGENWILNFWSIILVELLLPVCKRSLVVLHNLQWIWILQAWQKLDLSQASFQDGICF